MKKGINTHLLTAILLRSISISLFVTTFAWFLLDYKFWAFVLLRYECQKYSINSNWEFIKLKNISIVYKNWDFGLAMSLYSSFCLFSDTKWVSRVLSFYHYPAFSLPFVRVYGIFRPIWNCNQTLFWKNNNFFSCRNEFFIRRLRWFVCFTAEIKGKMIWIVCIK